MAESWFVRDIRVTFSTAAGPVEALREVNLDLASGEFVTVIGSNGAGKSTLVKVLAGAQKATSGSVHLGQRDVTDIPEHRRARWVARVSQDTTSSVCTELSVYDNLVLAMTRGSRRSPIRQASNKTRIARAVAALDSYGSGLSERVRQPAGLLSGGQRQLLALVMAVAVEPQLLLLDEHTSALDPQMAETVMAATKDIVQSRGLTTLMVTHNMDHAAAYGDRLLIMSTGRVVDVLDAPTRQALGPSGLVERFRSVAQESLTDRMLA